VTYPVPKSWAKCLLLIVSGSLCFASCSSKTKPPTNEPTNTQTFSSSPPFQTKEPENYRAVRTLTFTDTSGKSTTTKTTIAKFGALRREETDASPSVVLLELNEGQFMLYPNEKIYSVAGETGSLDTGDPNQVETSPNRLLHTDSATTTYERLGNEQIDGRSVIKYRVVVNTSGGTSVSLSETLMWVDETLGMPVKSETTSKDGSRSTMLLSEISTDLDQGLFQLPADYQKVALADFQSRLRRN
jgi:outer membrane lipoprotein-sorting protein